MRGFPRVVALWAYAEESSYSSGVWGTYRQWSEAGAQVRKGEKAAFVVFYKELEFAAETETGDAHTTTRLFARATPIFAAEQVDGYQAPVMDAPPATVITPIEQAEAFVAATGASVSHGGGRAFYRPSRIPFSCRRAKRSSAARRGGSTRERESGTAWLEKAFYASDCAR
jgi:antirestriction protein ArdC